MASVALTVVEQTRGRFESDGGGVVWPSLATVARFMRWKLSSA